MPQLFYQLPTSSGGTGVLDVNTSDTVDSLIGQLADQLGVPSASLACYSAVGGAALPGNQSLTQLAARGGTVRVSALLPGGKTHGQIGKAGKVRGQTPQVGKAADKPREKTGRARKRQLYNRRFPGTGPVAFVATDEAT